MRKLKFKDKKTNKRGQMIMVNLLMLFLAVTFLIALVPGFSSVIDGGLSYSSGLNCEGSPDYNATLGQKSDLGCIGLKLYLPYIILGGLAALMMKLFYNKFVDGGPSEPSYN